MEKYEEQIRKIALMLASAYWRGYLAARGVPPGDRFELTVHVYAHEDAPRREAAARFGLS